LLWRRPPSRLFDFLGHGLLYRLLDLGRRLRLTAGSALGAGSALATGFSFLLFSGVISTFGSTLGTAGVTGAAVATGGDAFGGAGGGACGGVGAFSSTGEASRREAIGTICPRATGLAADVDGAGAAFASGSSVCGRFSAPGERKGNSR